jgi:hypothetical protein
VASANPDQPPHPLIFFIYLKKKKKKLWGHFGKKKIVRIVELQQFGSLGEGGVQVSRFKH